MTFELTDDVKVDKDEKGNVHILEHFQQPFMAADAEAAAADSTDVVAPTTVRADTPQSLAEQYLREVAPLYGIDQNMLAGAAAPSSTDEESAGTESADGKLELVEEKDIMGTTTIGYQQTYNGLPVWKAGVSVTIQSEPLRVTASQSSVHHDIDVPQSSALDEAEPYGPDAITPTKLKSLLKITKGKPEITGTRKLIYQYDQERRIDPEASTSTGEALEGGPPTLPLPPLPAEIKAGEHYVVTEVLFTLPVEGFGPVNWRAFIEVNTGAVLYLRAFVACASGKVFKTDPLTAGAGAAVTPTAGAAVLNPFRSTVTLSGLTNANPQALSGQFVKLVELEAPVAAPPTQANPPASFSYDAPTREFAAANAYHHCDWLFRLMQGMGFNLASYFDGTSFPVPVEACGWSDAVNARAPGNATGTGSGGFVFGLAGGPFPAVSIAADVRVVLHEFGHTVLWDSVHSPNFGFAHSAGDSLAVVLMDPESALRNDPVKRFYSFPWITTSRQHGRDVAGGWAWGGTNDVGGYSSEQILSTTHFRIYRSLGGDSTAVKRRKMAARQTVYLIFRAIGSLASNPVTPTPNPGVFATALMNADIGTSNFEGYRGGAFHKVIRWGFEKQGLYQAAGTPTPFTTAGKPPKVDVYINDGKDYLGNQRNGEYLFQPVHWECRDIWNRLAPSAGGGGGVHQSPVVGQTNYAYVRVKNRGTQAATNVVVRGYSADPGAGLSWPGDWTPMGTPQLSVAAGIPAGGTVVVGPFKWKPKHVGHECMFMEVSAKGDLSNIDPQTFFPCATGPTPEWRLVPFDNNIGQRNVVPVAGGGGLRGLLTSFLDRKFVVRNPLDKQTRIEVKAEMPKFLTALGWGIQLNQRDNTSAFGLAAGNTRDVAIELKPGKEFKAADIEKVKDGVNIRLLVYADDMIIGGMTYELVPGLKQAPIEKKGQKLIPLNHPAIEELIRNAQFDDGETEALVAADDTAYAEDAETALEGGTESDATATAAQLLSQLGVPDGTVGKVNRVRVKKLTVEVELDD
jgi:zinc metalloprotease ZmpB